MYRVHYVYVGMRQRYRVVPMNYTIGLGLPRYDAQDENDTIDTFALLIQYATEFVVLCCVRTDT
jgi:hypothetical protein